jgi:sugar lactone lactonase YvrE
LKTLSSKKAILAIFVVMVTAFVSCSKKGDSPSPSEAKIVSLSTNQGPYNTLVEINGTGFSNVPLGSKVYFNGKETTVYLATSTRLTVLVPLAAGTGPVTVSTGGKTATGPIFSYQQALVVTIFAGDEHQYGVDDGVVGVGKFREANRIAFDNNGNMYITDLGNNTIRKATPDGTLTTFAGGGTRGTADGLGKQAKFDGPTGIAVDAAGNVYVTDNNSNLIRKITPQGQVTTLAGNTSGKYQDGTGKSAGFDGPIGLTIDAAGNLFVAERDSRIRKVTPDGVVTTFAGNGNFNLTDGVGIAAGVGTPIDITIDKAGNLYTLDGQSGVVRKITPAALVATYVDASTHEPGVSPPYNLAMDKLGNLYLSEIVNFSIKVVKPDKTISVYAGGFSNSVYNGPALKALLVFPQGIAFDSDNNLYFTDRSAVRKVWVQ